MQNVFVWTLQDVVGLMILAGFAIVICGCLVIYKAQRMWRRWWRH